MRKRYSSSAQRFTIGIKVDGKKQFITFPGNDPELKRRYFDTEDEKVQEALERSPSFNVYFTMDGTQPSVAPPKQEPAVKTFKNFVECKDWLWKEMKVPFNKVMNKANAAAEAKKLGYEVKYLSDKEQ